jgi:Uma2 family endonuclease
MARSKAAKTIPEVGKSVNGLSAIQERLCPWLRDPVLRRLQPRGMPLLFGNEDLEMGESTVPTITAGILLYGLGFHFAQLTGYHVFANLNLYYSDDPAEYLSPDVMVVKPPRTLPVQLSSYRIGQQGPGPVLVGEVLSFRTWQEGDMSRKPQVYSTLGVKEYIVADVTGEMLEERLLLLRPQPDDTWRDEQDPDGGITSQFGFRILIETDGQLRLIDGKTGERYPRPEEALAEARGRRQAEEQIRALKEENARLRGATPKDEPKGKGRRRKS